MGAEMKMRIGFVGVGLMGHGMAKNLVEKGFPLKVMGHKNRKPVEDLRKRGAKEATSVANLVDATDIIILCVTGTPQVEDIVYRKDGLMALARKGMIIIDASSSEPASTAKIHADFKKKGIVFVDAPLTRTPVEAEQGRLNTLVGADAKTFKTIKPVLQAYCENIFHIGPSCAGHKIKLINNFFAIGTMALIAEAYTTCVKVGLDPKKFVELVGKGAVNSNMFQMVAGGAAEGDFTRAKFAIVNGYKDATYYNRMIDHEQIVGPLAAAVQQSLKHANALGFGEEFMPSLIKAQCAINHTEL
jgi:3-hydroxyisobutyrate dehydrogenase-like beta-hydroxyacid dehydrogenase